MGICQWRVNWRFSEFSTAAGLLRGLEKTSSLSDENDVEMSSYTDEHHRISDCTGFVIRNR